ncbi:LacI family transcriptional regulator [Candidatus Nomurabacteria bacterium]|nr:LacI family transcriptional regulator [Candidatus Nomurabacteria bacterium]
MSKKITMEDIAKELGISKSIVSRALNDRYGISNDTRSRVKLTALKMGYKVFTPKKGAFDKPESITIVVERYDLKDASFWVSIIDSIEKKLTQKGISVFLSILDKDDDDFLPISIRQMKSSGVFIIGQIPLKVILSVINCGVSVVLIDSSFTFLKLDMIHANNFSGAYEATEYLIKEGHKKIGFIGSVSYAYSFKDRHRGFLQCIRQNGLCDPDLYSVTDKHDSYEVPFSTAEFECKINRDIIASSYLCANDVIASQIYDILKKHGLRIPEDVSVIGFDNITRCLWISPKLTTMDIPKSQIGESAVDVMLSRIREPKSNYKQMLIGTELIVRDSVRRITDLTE